jgi:small-conductance mechanosensitive channel
MKILKSVIGLLLLVLTAEAEKSYAQPASTISVAANVQFVSASPPSFLSTAAAAPIMLQAQAPNDSTTAEKVDKKVQDLKELFSFGMILTILVIIIITYLLVRASEYILNNLSERASQHRLIIKRLIPILRIFLWVVALYIIIAGIVDPNIQTLIAVAGAIGIAVGLASQEILKNIFGGIMIILDKPFQVGDKIAFGDHYGEVQQIGLRSTRLITPDDSLVTIPNGEVISNAVSNTNSGELNCQVVAEIFLPATTDIAVAKQIARKAAVSSQYVYLKKPIVIIAVNEVHEKNFIIKLRVKAYVLDIRFEFPFQSDMTEQITTELNRRALLPHAEMEV